MIFIALATVTSVLMLVILRLFEKNKVHTFYALIFNYLSAFICGIINQKVFYPDIKIYMSQESWVLTSIEGVLFITVFYWIAQTTKHYGMSVASVANKMSLVFPVVTSYILFNEPMNTIKWAGLLLALFSVYLVTYTKNISLNNSGKFIFPLLVFVGSGVVDSIINYGNKTYVRSNEQQLMFASFVYAFALITGLLFLKIIPPDKTSGKRFYHQNSYRWKSTILLGLLLGVPNYYNLFFIIQSLNSHVLLSGQIFLILNLSNVIVSSLVGVFIFKEKLLWLNWMGITGAVCAILLMK